MIVAKLKDGKFVSDTGRIVDEKKNYEAILVKAEALKEPSDKELIELGRQFHPFYMRDIDAANAVANIAAIEAFEKPKDKE